MKKIFFVLFLLFLFAGCAQLKDQKANFDECWKDPGCRSHALEVFKEAQIAGATAGSFVPIPGVGAVSGVALGGLAFLIAMLSGGAALRKKKEEEPNG